MRADASFAVPVKLWALLCVFAGVTIGGNVLLTCILTGGALLYLVLQRNFRLAASYGCFYLLLALLLPLRKRRPSSTSSSLRLALPRCRSSSWSRRSPVWA